MKTPGLEAFASDFYQTLKKEMTQTADLLQKEKRREPSSNHLMRLAYP